MEEQTKDGTENYVVVFVGKFYRIQNKNGGTYLDGSYTSRSVAEKAIKAYVNNKITEENRLAVKRIKNSDVPVSKKMKEYKKACQELQKLS